MQFWQFLFIFVQIVTGILASSDFPLHSPSHRIRLEMEGDCGGNERRSRGNVQADPLNLTHLDQNHEKRGSLPWHALSRLGS